MSKRHLNKQQQRRIQKIQQKFQQDSLHNAETGLVLTRFGKSAEIEDPLGIRRHCSIRPNIDCLVAGDKVSWLNEGQEEGVVVSRHQRHSALVRHGKQGAGKMSCC